MLEGATIGVGTVGSGAWFSFNGGDRFRHVPARIDPESNVRSLAVSPHDSATVYAVVDFGGLYVSHDGGYRWEPVNQQLRNEQLWSLACDPTDPQRLYVGGRPGVYRSEDGGATFDALPTGLGPECPIGTPRVTNVVIDPHDVRQLWVGVEVDGIYHSADGGDSWEHLGPIGETQFHGDIHGLALRSTGSNGSSELLTTTPFGLATSADHGQNWTWRAFDGFTKGSGNPYAYCRGVFVWPGQPDTILVGCGDFIPGRVGAVEISRDGGQSWQRADLPVEANSTVYWMATHPELDGMIVAATVFGQLFVSDDHGASWTKLEREFGEIRCVTLAPTPLRAA